MTSAANQSDRPRWVTSERFWMLLCIVIFLAIVASWIPSLGLPLGDDHQGRILGRMALHADNFLARGWSGSNYIADWMPYSGVPYAHHPPLQQFMHAGFASLTNGASAFGVRTIEFVGGLLSAGILVVFVRRLSGSWLPAAFAMGGLAVSGFFWLFGRSWGLVFVSGYFLVHLIDERRPTRTSRTALVVIALLAALQSWQAALTIGLLATVDLFWANRKRAIGALAGLAGGLGLDLLWIESAAGIGALAGHLEERISAADYAALDWLARQLGFLARFETIPTVLLAAAGVTLGLRDRRYRPYMSASLLSVLLFSVVFYQNAWVHEYWNWRVALVIGLAMASLGTWLAAKSRPSWARWGMTALLIFAAVVPLLRLGGDLYAVQYVESSDAGYLAEQMTLPPGQTIAWYQRGISGPRWLSWYADLPARQVNLMDPPAPDQMVFVKRAPGDGLENVKVVSSGGRYAVVRADALVEANE